MNIRHEVCHCIRCIYKESTDKRKRASLCDRKGIWKVQGIDQKQKTMKEEEIYDRLYCKSNSSK